MNTVRSDLPSILQLHTNYREGTATVRGTVDEAWSSRDRHVSLNAWITSEEPANLAESQARIDAGEMRLLEGVPVAVKDIIDVAGMRTTNGSGQAFHSRARDDAAVVALLKSQGALILGKVATEEFAFGITSKNAHFGPTRNPLDPTLTPGGSSGGSAVAVAAGDVFVSVGTDTTGSVRIPAAFCGVVGFKPTFGSLSGVGVTRLAPSLDTVGIIARSVADTRTTLAALNVDVEPADPREAHVMWLKRLDGVAVEPAIDTELRKVAERLNATEVSLPEQGIYELLGDIVTTEALQVHKEEGWWPAAHDAYSPLLRHRLQAAESNDLQDYLQATLDRSRMRSLLGHLLGDSVLLLPTSGAFPIAIEDVDDPVALAAFRRGVMTYCGLASLTGFPAIALPVPGRDFVSLQLIAAPGRDRQLLAAAEWVESIIATF
ncbi:amidase [Corynebacterium nasicanis]|uniref:amidase n=1 Tax=Corynebacterium nasicanis TaxID=1448267 RepID=A0ABW1QCR2_9CORY